MTTNAEVVTLNNGFTVTAATPVLTSVNPNTGQQGQQNLSVSYHRTDHSLRSRNDDGELRRRNHGGVTDRELGDQRHGSIEH